MERTQAFCRSLWIACDPVGWGRAHAFNPIVDTALYTIMIYTNQSTLASRIREAPLTHNRNLVNRAGVGGRKEARLAYVCLKGNIKRLGRMWRWSRLSVLPLFQLMQVFMRLGNSLLVTRTEQRDFSSICHNHHCMKLMRGLRIGVQTSGDM